MNLHSRKAGKLSTRELCILSLMGALMFASQLVMSGLANVHIIAPLIIVCCAVFAWKAMYAVILFVLLEALVWGLGLWVISYFYLWPALALAAIVMHKNDSALIWAVLAAVHGLLFGAGCAIPYFFIGGFEMAFSYWVSGIPFDLVHCAGNFVLTLAVYRPLKNVLFKVLKK